MLPSVFPYVFVGLFLSSMHLPGDSFVPNQDKKAPEVKALASVTLFSEWKESWMTSSPTPPIFTDMDTEVQSGQVTCPKSHRL